jgi:hypothetical protein
MKKIIVALIVLCINVNTLVAQKGVKEIGLQGGLISSNFWSSAIIPKKGNLNTYFFGGSFGYSLNKTFSLRANLSYETKGEESKIPPTDPFGNQLNGYTSYKLNYTTLHLLTRGGYGEKVHCYLEAGPFVSYLINAKAVGVSNGTVTGVYYGSLTNDITSSFKNISIGASAGVGATYPITKKMKINLTVRRSISLTSINKSEYIFFEAKTNSLQIFTGLDLKL